ncbi:CLIP-associating protein [Melipona quadrifasciata]|uniref:CLIP-associating protein n=1 Tax=Melipona quadrifasciata TaxID=166423 RepID=A0A0M9AAW2_9HYME|nr:CLIP-associating protein [Melipona quadrifasciata]
MIQKLRYERKSQIVDKPRNLQRCGDDVLATMAVNPHDMDGFMPLLSTTDIKKKLNVGSLLLNYLGDATKSIECQDIGQFIDNIIPWLSNGNPKLNSKYRVNESASNYRHWGLLSNKTFSYVQTSLLFFSTLTMNVYCLLCKQNRAKDLPTFYRLLFGVTHSCHLVFMVCRISPQCTEQNVIKCKVLNEKCDWKELAGCTG